MVSRNTDDVGVHIFDNGICVEAAHLLDVQIERYSHNNVHEPIEEEWFRTLIRAFRGDVFRFIDVGAGIGYYSLLVKKLWPGAEIHCFEPLSEHAACILRNVALNGLGEDAVRIWREALSDRIGVANFVCNHYGSKLFETRAPGSRAGNVDEVPTTTLTEVLRIVGSASLVKIDVQGDELRVLEGAGSEASSIGALVVGTHSGDIHRACLDYCSGRGFRVVFDDVDPPGQPDGIVVAVQPDGPFGSIGISPAISAETE